VLLSEKWEEQKDYKISQEKPGAIYRQLKINVEPVFGFLKANFCHIRFSVRVSVRG